MPLISRAPTDRMKMGVLSQKLNRRAVIQKLVKEVFDGDSPGSYKTAAPILNTYEDIKTLWCYILPKQGESEFISAIRGQQDMEEITHEIWVRWESVASLGTTFSPAFANSFDSVRDINVIKSEYYILVRHGSATIGRRFQIKETRWDEVSHEYIRLRCMEIEEVGTGYTP